jgi:hypothetical protein
MANLDGRIVAMPDEADEDALARDMIEVHGMEAPGVARANARTAALAGAVASAKRWIRVLEVIQRRGAEQTFEKYTSARYTLTVKSQMMISFASNRADGFKKWSDAHRWIMASTASTEQSTVIPHNRDSDIITSAVAEGLRGPWLVPGVGLSI